MRYVQIMSFMKSVLSEDKNICLKNI